MDIHELYRRFKKAIESEGISISENFTIKGINRLSDRLITDPSLFVRKLMPLLPDLLVFFQQLDLKAMRDSFVHEFKKVEINRASLKAWGAYAEKMLERLSGEVYTRWPKLGNFMDNDPVLTLLLGEICLLFYSLGGKESDRPFRLFLEVLSVKSFYRLRRFPELAGIFPSEKRYLSLADPYFHDFEIIGNLIAISYQSARRRH